jgi:hypothetical protein
MTENVLLQVFFDLVYRCSTRPHHDYAVFFLKFDMPLTDFPKFGRNRPAAEGILIDDKQVKQLPAWQLEASQ